MRTAYRETVQLQSSPHVGSGMICAPKPVPTGDSSRTWPVMALLVYVGNVGKQDSKILTYYIRIGS